MNDSGASTRKDTSFFDEEFSRLDLDKDHAVFQGRVDEMVKDILHRGVPISYRDPAYGNRLVREYPDGHKVALGEDASGELIELPLEDGRAAA